MEVVSVVVRSLLRKMRPQSYRIERNAPNALSSSQTS
jgi:hypothetical protein